MDWAGATSCIGREEDLGRIEVFLKGVREGSATLLLEGEAGIGKTTLWRAGVERARELGLRILEARPVAPECELSFSALGDLLAGLHDEIGGLPGPQRSALRIALLLEEAEKDLADQRAVGAALLGLLRRLAEDESVLIALDDLQWLDPPTSRALQFALRRLDAEPVRTLATLRLRTSTTISFESGERFEVLPLALDELDHLVRTRLGARFLRPTLRQLEESSGGNPFYALEIAVSLLRSGRRLEPGEALPIPARLREVVQSRLATLTPDAHEAALVTAALAQPSVAIVEQLIGGGTTAVSEAVAVGVLDRDGQSLRFTHPLFASTLYDDIHPKAKRDLHRRLAAIVDDSEESARHLAEAADGPDEKVASALEAASTNVAARGAPDAAARLAKQAYDLTPPERRSEAHRRRLAWSRYSVLAGDPAHAESLLERQLELSESGRDCAEVAFELGKARLATSGVSPALACYERALGELKRAGEVELRTQILIELAQLHLQDGRMDSDASDQAVALAEKIGEPDLLARALGLHGAKLMLLGKPPPDTYWRRALEIEAATPQLRYGGPTNAYAFVAVMRGDFKTAAELNARVADSMRRAGDAMLPDVLSVLSEGARISGDWDAAARYAEEAYEWVVQTGHESLEPWCLLAKARVALPRGDLDLAHQHASEAIALLERLPPSDMERGDIEWTTKSLFGQIALVSGRHAEAHECFTAAIGAAQRFETTRHAVGELLAGDIECLVALGALEDASRQLERLVKIADELAMPTLNGIAARAKGVVAAAEGDSSAALNHLGRAVEFFEALPASWPFEHAQHVARAWKRAAARPPEAGGATNARASAGDVRASGRPPMGRKDAHRAPPGQRAAGPLRSVDPHRAERRVSGCCWSLKRRGGARALHKPEDGRVESLEDLQKTARALTHGTRGKARNEAPAFGLAGFTGLDAATDCTGNPRLHLRHTARGPHRTRPTIADVKSRDSPGRNAPG